MKSTSVASPSSRCSRCSARDTRQAERETSRGPFHSPFRSSPAVLPPASPASARSAPLRRLAASTDTSIRIMLWPSRTLWLVPGQGPYQSRPCNLDCSLIHCCS